MAQDKINAIIERHKKLKAKKEPWLNTYSYVGKYVMTRKQDFMGQPSPGEILTADIFDSTAQSAVHVAASAIIGALWPNAGRTFQIMPPVGMDREVAQSEDVKNYYEKVTEKVRAAIDHPKANFLPSLEEYMLDQLSFGTSGIHVEETNDPDMPVRFEAVDVKKICIDEGENGFVDTVYAEQEYTVRQLIQKYGEAFVSQQSREAFHNGRDDEKVKVLRAIEPRMDAIPGAFGAANMPVASIHIELGARHELLESGFPEMCTFVSRFWKTMGEIYGRSPAMECMPDILEANALREAVIVATEKMLDPPVLITDDGSLGGCTINLSAGATMVRRVSGRMNDLGHKAIEPIITVAELNTTYKRLTDLRESIFNAFFVDRLLDLNNEQRMTLGEANIRNELRGQSINTIYSRQIAELFTRIIEYTFHTMYAKRMLGVAEGTPEAMLAFLEDEMPFEIPGPVADLIAQGKDVYQVTYISPAARIMRSEELLGIQQTVQFATEVGRVSPEALDVIDFDNTMRALQELSGAPSRVLKSSDRVKQLRDERAQQQQQMMQLQVQQIQAETAKSGALAAKAAAGAQKGG